MPNAILEMMMLAMSKVFSIAQGHLFTTVPERNSGKRQSQHSKIDDMTVSELGDNFTGQETVPERSCDLPSVTQLISSKAEIRTQESRI